VLYDLDFNLLYVEK